MRKRSRCPPIANCTTTGQAEALNLRRPSRHADDAGAPHRLIKRTVARHLADELAASHGRGAFDRLVLVAPPEMLGNLRSVLGTLTGVKVNRRWSGMLSPSCNAEDDMSAPAKTKTAKTTVVPLKRVRLELARDQEFPDGSRDHGYDLIIPLDKAGHLSPSGWKRDRDHCRVRRFWGHEAELIGHVMHKPGGRGGIWAFHYDIRSPAETRHDEAGFHFETHTFKPGEYVSIREQDGVLRTFRVQAVVDLD